MIRIRAKSAKSPNVLRAKGKNARLALCVEYALNSADYDSGKKKFAFDLKLYGHAAVKRALLKAQAGKCAFCESKINHVDFGDVEHFRPKAGWRQSARDTLHRPGYYWLTYEWSNLFLACAICNQKFKRNFFPLKDPKRRALRHTDDVTLEEPLLLDPGVDDPETFISFREEVPYAIGGKRGTRTISMLGLKRAALAERRRDYLVKVKALRLIASTPYPEAADAKNKLLEMKQDSAEYASMVRAYLQANP